MDGWDPKLNQHLVQHSFHCNFTPKPFSDDYKDGEASPVRNIKENLVMDSLLGQTGNVSRKKQSGVILGELVTKYLSWWRGAMMQGRLPSILVLEDFLEEVTS